LYKRLLSGGTTEKNVRVMLQKKEEKKACRGGSEANKSRKREIKKGRTIREAFLLKRDNEEGESKRKTRGTYTRPRPRKFQGGKVGKAIALSKEKKNR